jgi:hypothetical protein
LPSPSAAPADVCSPVVGSAAAAFAFDFPVAVFFVAGMLCLLLDERSSEPIRWIRR